MIRLLVGALVGILMMLGAAGTAAADELDWGPCEEGQPAPFQCATLDVPLDYERPRGATLSLALIRHPATDPGRRIGSLFLNPGGPGGSGVNMTFGITPFLPEELVERFDLVGFDPRGVARSDGLQCWTAAEYDAAFAATRLFPTPPSFRTALRRAREFIDACVERSARLLPYIGTEYVARDLDRMRDAVDDRKLSYFGFSYGSFIGTVYANLFPNRVRALTLDGAYDPVTYSSDPYEYDRKQYVAVERALTVFLAWCSDNPVACGFGDGDAERAFDRLMRRLDANAASTLVHVALAMGDGQEGYTSLGATLAETEATDGASGFPPISVFANRFGPNVAVECADRDFPRSRALLRTRLAQHAALGKRLGPVFAYGPPAYDHSHATACVQWPAFASDHAPSRYRGDWSARGAAPILVVGTTGDPDTPYPDAVTLSRTLDSGMLISLRGEGHTAFLRSQCVTDEVVRYLVTERRPRVAWCDDQPPAE